jgi:tRNA threonylcarbamoyladenosine biosynthesis protein TsaB
MSAAGAGARSAAIPPARCGGRSTARCDYNRPGLPWLPGNCARRLPVRAATRTACTLNVLALDTSTDLCSVALWRDGEVAHEARVAGQTHSQLLLPMLDGLLRGAGLVLADIDAIAFGAGPGSFTGLRIACGVAQGMALGATIPVVGVCTLLAVAEAAGAGRAVCCLDARMHEVYHAAFVRSGATWQIASAPGLYAPALVPVAEGGGWMGCGNGFAAYAQPLVDRLGGALCGTRPELVPHAREIAILGAAACARGEAVPPEQALPVYIRNKVALTVAEQK